MSAVQHIPGGDYVGINEAAKIAGCSARTIRRLIANREIRAYQLQSKVWIIPIESARKAKSEPNSFGRPRGS